jgi:hypothetical protein
LNAGPDFGASLAGFDDDIFFFFFSAFNQRRSAEKKGGEKGSVLQELGTGLAKKWMKPKKRWKKKKVEVSFETRF